jgi:hypothetical protein
MCLYVLFLWCSGLVGIRHVLVCVCVTGAAVDWWALGICLYVFVLQELQWTGGH